MEKTSGIAKTAIVLAIIGAINWGLIGFFNFNLVDAIFGGGAREQVGTFSRVIYAIVGIAGVAAAYYLPKLRQEKHAGAGSRREAHP